MMRYINAQAKSLKEINNDVKSHITELERNFIMILLDRDVQTRNHWEHEIYTQISDVPIAKDSNTYPTEKQLYRWMYLDNVADFNEPKKFKKLLTAILKKEKHLHFSGNIREFQDEVVITIEKYLRWLSCKLSESGYVESYEVYEFLDSII